MRGMTTTEDDIEALRLYFRMTAHEDPTPENVRAYCERLAKKRYEARLIRFNGPPEHPFVELDGTPAREWSELTDVERRGWYEA
jgi:acetyl esterase/lipase